MRAGAEPPTPRAPDDLPPRPAPRGRRNWGLPLRGSRGSYAGGVGPTESGPRPSPLTDPVPADGLISPFRLPAEIEAGWRAPDTTGRERP
jgi:hypothetical protein